MTDMKRRGSKYERMNENKESECEEKTRNQIKSALLTLTDYSIRVCVCVLSVYRRPWILITFEMLCASCESVYVCEEWVVG